MVRYISLVVVFFLFSAQQVKMAKTRISDNITARLPADFSLLPPEELAFKSASYRMPIAYYTDPARQIDFSVNNSVTKWQSTDISLVQEIYKSNINNLFDEVDFLNEGIETINNRDYITFEFLGTIMPGESLVKQEVPVRKYFYIQYTIKEGMIYIFTFIAPMRQKEEWQPVAGEIMHSINIK